MGLRAQGLVEPLRNLQVPLMGICLGMQLLFESSEEGDVAGLGLLVLAKRLGFPSALRAPSHLLPKPDLSELVERWLRRGVEHARGRLPDAGLVGFLRFCHDLGRFAAGRARLGRRFLPI